MQLFLTVLTLFVLQASLEQTELSTLLEVFVGGAAFMLTLRLAQVQRRVLFAGSALVALFLAGSVIQLFVGQSSGTTRAALFVSGVLVLSAPPMVFTALRRLPSVEVRTVLGAITIYMLIGLFFAYVYRAFVQFNANAFVTGQGTLSPSSMQYLSFVTLTTVGFGDITPATNLARTTVALEALIGQVYLVTVVALVVSNLGLQRHRKSSS
jgi:hypothetical protein